jgi:hypothetical protein
VDSGDCDSDVVGSCVESVEALEDVDSGDCDSDVVDSCVEPV